MEKKTKSKKKEGLITATFLNKDGKKVNVSDIISTDNCWFLSKANSWILTHRAIKDIAVEGGISKNFDVVESTLVAPTYQNELEHVVRVTIKCLAKKKSGIGCVHSEEDSLTITGEANRVNTPNRGRGYLRKMAEKRAFDIAVLEHLNLYSSVFSEEEAREFDTVEKREPDLVVGSSDFEAITKEVNAILNATTYATLKKVADKIKRLKGENKYNIKQIKYLTGLYKQQYGNMNKDL